MSFVMRHMLSLGIRSCFNNLLTNKLRTLSVSSSKCQEVAQADQLKCDEENIEHDGELELRQKCFAKINEQLASKSEGRLFAVVHLCGKQFKVTAGDIILVEGYWPPTIGDRIRLDKVLLAAAKDFTLIGTPILEPGLVDVQATIVEKTLAHTKTHFKKKRRKQYMRINFQRSPNTMIRINTIEIKRNVDMNDSMSVNDKRLF